MCDRFRERGRALSMRIMSKTGWLSFEGNQSRRQAMVRLVLTMQVREVVGVEPMLEGAEPTPEMVEGSRERELKWSKLVISLNR